MADIFLSYRRADSRSATGRLADSLLAAFGSDQVFRDLDSIPPGQDFEAALARAIGGARVMLAVVGPRWAEVCDAQGRPRLHDPHDVVRREIEAALAAGLPMIPVLVEGARMPDASTLPPSLASFARCQAVVLGDDAGWHDDVARLVSELQRRHGLESSAAAPVLDRSWARLLDGLELLVRPRRVILRLAGTGGRDTLVRAALLLAAALALGNLLIGQAMGLGLELIGWVLNGTVVCLVVSALLTGLLALAWRVTGMVAGWQRLASGMACLVAGAWLYLSVGLMFFAIGVGMAEPGVFTTLLERWRSGDPAPMATALAAVKGSALAGIVLATAVWAAGGIWLLVAWNALRIAFGARRWQALLAALVACGLLVALVRAAQWAAT